MTLYKERTMKHLFIVAHPDDEILGCFGTISALIEKNEEVSVAILSKRSVTREDGLDDKAILIHKELGVTTHFADYETMKFGQYDRYEMTKCVEDIIKAEEPDFVYTHDNADIHNDHRVLSSIVLEASKLPFRGTGYTHKIKGIYFIEIPSSTDWGYGFTPNAYFEIDENSILEKERYLRGYADVIREIPHPRNAETFRALARYRGSQCGVDYAEAYKKVLEVNV